MKKPFYVSLAFIVLLSVLFSLFIGPVSISPLEIFSFKNIPEWQKNILLHIRLPRVLLCFFVGANLSITGATLQSLFRNPLADPGIIGVSSGAAFGAVIAIFFGLNQSNPYFLSLSAFFMSVVTILSVFFFSVKKNLTTSSFRFILSGVAIGSLMTSLTTFILSISFKDNYSVGREIVFWLLGGGQNASISDVYLILPFSFMGFILVYRYRLELDAILLGELHALTIGVSTHKTQIMLIIITSLLTALSVSLTGIIGFVGLIVPYTIRMFFGSNHSKLIPLSYFFGGIFLLLIDDISRAFFQPEEIKLGVLTSLIGAPFFLIMLFRSKNKSFI